MVELALAAFATVVWSFLPEGPLRSAVFVMATSAWVLTLVINLNPVMRFDGYFLLSDLVGIENLQERAFAMGRWWLRETIFGFGDQPPEAAEPARMRFLVTFAFAAWLYRLVLFFVIAFLILELVIKPVAVVMISLQIGFFLLRPIGAELAVWFGRREEIRLRSRTIAAGLLVLCILGLVIFPWQSSVSGPAVLRSEQEQILFASEAARIQEIDVRNR